MDILKEIMSEVFPGEDTSPYTMRFEILYHVVLEYAEEKNLPILKKEITECEKLYAENTRLESALYTAPNEEMVLRMYSGVAYTFALKKLKTGANSLCPAYLSEVLLKLLDNGLISEKAKRTNRLLISEAFVDFQYAAGKSQNMSFRLHQISK